MSATVERLQRSIRFPVKDLAEIDKRATAYGLDRTRFLIDAALERLPDNISPEQRIDQLEQRIQRLEAFAFNA